MKKYLKILIIWLIALSVGFVISIGISKLIHRNYATYEEQHTNELIVLSKNFIDKAKAYRIINDNISTAGMLCASSAVISIAQEYIKENKSKIVEPEMKLKILDSLFNELLEISKGKEVS